VFAAIEYVAKPSDFATGLLVTGVGFALIAAVSVMAATFQRNIKAGINGDFTKAAVLVAYVGAALVVVGTIRSLGKTDTFVTDVALANLGLAILVIISALHAQRIFRRDVRCQKDACCCCVQREQHGGKNADDPCDSVGGEVKRRPHAPAVQEGVDDGQHPETPAERCKWRGLQFRISWRHY
jgi:hypothetical protein